MKSPIALAVALVCLHASFALATQGGSCKVGLTQDPLVMRIGKDEFRIAFGLDGAACGTGGCSGEIRYATTWRAEDGADRIEDRRVSYTIPEGAPRSLTVDRSYFDDGESHHTTEVVKVDVTAISCANPTDDVARR